MMEMNLLEGISEKTKVLFEKYNNLVGEEMDKGGVLNVDTKIVSKINSHQPGYLDQENEVIVGLQTDEPLKERLCHLVAFEQPKAAEAYGYKIDDEIVKIFTDYRKTHNQGVFDVYTSEMRKARHSGVITGLPDGYGRGRIIGDYRRVPLYGVDRLIEVKEQEKMLWTEQ